MPSKIGMIKKEGPQDKLILDNFKLGDSYIQMLSDGIQTQPIKNYHLSGNRITERGANLLLPQISKSAKEIYLGSNKIGRTGCEHITSIIGSPNYNIQILNLEDNNLGDIAIANLLK